METQNLEQKAREALGFIPTSGLEFVSRVYGEGLQYGLEQGLFTQKEVDAAQVQFREYQAREALGFIPTSGLKLVSSAFGEGLQYGLEQGLFTQKEVDAAQKEYTRSQKHTRSRKSKPAIRELIEHLKKS